MKIGLVDADMLDGGTNFPNLSLMKLSTAHKIIGNEIELILSYENLEVYDKLYVAKVFEFTRVPELPNTGNVFYNGTGFFYDKAIPLPNMVDHLKPDYSLYDRIEGNNYRDYSIGYTTRGCFRKCSFCCNKRYDKVELWSPINEFFDPSRKFICCLDDNILGYPGWKDIMMDLQATGRPFTFKQGLDLRLMTDEKAEFISSVRYKGDHIFAFDHIKDTELIQSKLEIWKRYSPVHNTKLYVLCAYESQGIDDIIGVFERIRVLFKMGCLPYIMRYKGWDQSPMRGMYIAIAGWCNQVSLVKKKSFREFCYLKNKATIRYLEEFEQKYPSVAKIYFDMKLEEIRN